MVKHSPTIVILCLFLKVLLASPIDFLSGLLIKNNIFDDRVQIGGPIDDEFPTVEEGADVARTLVNRESLVNVNTFTKIKDSGDSETLIPVSSMEYYADCDNDGDPYWLVIDIGSTFQNIKHGSEYTFTIRAGDHPSGEKVDENYPGGRSWSPAGSPRVNLRGTLQNVTFENPLDLIHLEHCFVKRHPDAKWWLPSNAITPHKAHWVKFVVSGVYFVGGFGDRAYIGPIDSELYHSAKVV
ncbi:hypothetical protein HYPBUDRAFT_152535 [Hyphopichia burtonii NRRL Y-1933]|uniref:CREG-like beta-barrel domain-containing protein n=1 Tax=Hyphopichia burtonii NRRL Y-1933 TaxID=984485 RepID=A0A1E4RKA4_9ASCO|nr:hypothetical protein HYPBUDRAFT_152535 [Hyphopichia burtonii NRRL Y-1933]ODV67714.1 hypothetical protein HYPBUDRAFT_152535 [Hyphopichia burtonii NRRL Y-1933]